MQVGIIGLGVVGLSFASVLGSKGLSVVGMDSDLKKIKKNADLILASNVFAHSDELKMMAECMLKLIKNLNLF